MTLQNALVSTDRLAGDLHLRERVLNAAIAHAEISEGFEEYLEIFDASYADDIVVSSDTRETSIRGKANVRSFLFNFLVPLHVMGAHRQANVRRANRAPGQSHRNGTGSHCRRNWQFDRPWVRDMHHFCGIRISF